MASTDSGTAMPSDSVDFIYKDNAICMFLSLVEYITNPICSHSDKHFNKIRARYGKKGPVGLSCRGFCNHGLATTRRSNQKNALRDSTTKRSEFCRVFQKIDNFDKLLFGFINPCNIFKGDFVLSLLEHFSRRFTEAHRRSSYSLKLP